MGQCGLGGVGRIVISRKLNPWRMGISVTSQEEDCSGILQRSVCVYVCVRIYIICVCLAVHIYTPICWWAGNSVCAQM